MATSSHEPTARYTSRRQLYGQSLVAWVSALGSVVAALLLGFVLLEPATTKLLLSQGGYFFLTLIFLGFVGSVLTQAWRSHSRPPGLHAWLTVAAGCVLVFMADSLGHKVLFDESVLQCTAMDLYENREVGTVYRAFWFGDTWATLDAYLDKRPYFFAYLVSLLHNLTGYRASNVYVVNVALVPLFVSMVYWLGKRLGGGRSAVVAVLLMGSLPLLGHCALSGAMEVHNLTMLVALVCLSVRYLESPGRLNLASLCLALVLLSQSRYESILFSAAVALVTILGWVRRGKALITPELCLLPLLLVPSFWHNRIIDVTPTLWELKPGQVSRFSMEYLSGNWDGFLGFHFHLGKQQANSLLLSFGTLVLAPVGMWLWLRSGSRTRKLSGNEAWWCWAAFALICVCLTIMLFFYYWARLDDPMASRFALPAYLFAALGCAGIYSKIAERHRWVIHAGRVAFVLYMAAYFLPKAGGRFYTHSNLLGAQIDWEIAQIKARPGLHRLVIAGDSVMPFIAERIPAIIMDRARKRLSLVAHQLEVGNVSEILVVQTLVPTSKEGDFTLHPGHELPESVKLETVALRRFGGSLRRISRVVSIDAKE